MFGIEGKVIIKQSLSIHGYRLFCHVIDYITINYDYSKKVIDYK